MNARSSRRLSRDELAIAKQLNAPPLPRDVFPISDPDLAHLSELLHRMSMCAEDTPTTRMAGEAIRVLHAYWTKANPSCEPQDPHQQLVDELARAGRSLDVYQLSELIEKAKEAAKNRKRGPLGV